MTPTIIPSMVMTTEYCANTKINCSSLHLTWPLRSSARNARLIRRSRAATRRPSRRRCSSLDYTTFYITIVLRTLAAGVQGPGEGVAKHQHRAFPPSLPPKSRPEVSESGSVTKSPQFVSNAAHGLSISWPVLPTAMAHSSPGPLPPACPTQRPPSDTVQGSVSSVQRDRRCPG